MRSLLLLSWAGLLIPILLGLNPTINAAGSNGTETNSKYHFLKCEADPPTWYQTRRQRSLRRMGKINNDRGLMGWLCDRAAAEGHTAGALRESHRWAQLTTEILSFLPLATAQWVTPETYLLVTEWYKLAGREYKLQAIVNGATMGANKEGPQLELKVWHKNKNNQVISDLLAGEAVTKVIRACGQQQGLKGAE